MPTLPSTSGTKSRTDLVAVAYRRSFMVALRLRSFLAPDVGARTGSPAQGYWRAINAVATAARPSPRPVRPSPSVVVAETDTGAPTASVRTASASPRRGPTLGRLPIT